MHDLINVLFHNVLNVNQVFIQLCVTIYITALIN